MSEPTYYDIPVPEELDKIISIHDGSKWINRIIPGTVHNKDGYISFTVNWAGSVRSFILAAELVAGYAVQE